MAPDVLFFFQRDPAALGLYEALERMILELVPDAGVRVQKTQITFTNPRVFAAVSFLPVRKKAQRPDHCITVTLGLGRRLKSSDAASEPYPNRWTNHFLIASPEELNGEFAAWVREAAAFSAAKQ